MNALKASDFPDFVAFVSSLRCENPKRSNADEKFASYAKTQLTEQMIRSSLPSRWRYSPDQKKKKKKTEQWKKKKKKTGANKGEKCLDAESGLCFGTGEWFILQNNHYHCVYGDQKLGCSHTHTHTHTQQHQMEALHPFNFSPAFPFPFFSSWNSHIPLVPYRSINFTTVPVAIHSQSHPAHYVF